MERRRSKRITKRLETKFSADGISNTGITSNLAKEGIFIRTLKGHPPPKILDLELYLPSGEKIILRGRINRTIKTQFQSIKNGMGIELIDPPAKYTEFIEALY